jgi:NADH-quinone oxidoreductase subunit J
VTGAAARRARRSPPASSARGFPVEVLALISDVRTVSRLRASLGRSDMLAPLLPAISLASVTLAQYAAAPVVSPVVILVLCLAAGIGTVLLLPGRREGPVRKIGGVVVIATALILAALLVRYAANHGGGMGLYFWLFAAIALGGATRVVTHPRPVYSALYFVLTVFASAGLFILLWAEFMAAALVLIYAGAILVTYVFVIMLATHASPTGGGTEGSTTPAPAGGNGSPAPGGPPRLAGLAEYDAVSREPLVAAAVGFALMGVLLFVVFDKAEATRPAPESRTYTFELADAQGRVVQDEIVAASPDDVREELSRRGFFDATSAKIELAGSTQSLGRYLFANQAVNLELAGLILTVSMVGAIVIARRRVLVPETPGVPPRGRLAPAIETAPMTPVDDNPHSIPVYGTDNPRQKAYPEA